MADPIIILLVEDNPGDVLLTQEAFADSHIANELHVVTDGEQALCFLQHNSPYADAPTPDLILMDLNLPRLNGHALLERIKQDKALRTIPVVMLTTSEAENDIKEAYRRHVNAFVTKPLDLEQFDHIVRTIESFWFSIVRLPKKD